MRGMGRCKLSEKGTGMYWFAFVVMRAGMKMWVSNTCTFETDRSGKMYIDTYDTDYKALSTNRYHPNPIPSIPSLLSIRSTLLLLLLTSDMISA